MIMLPPAVKRVRPLAVMADTEAAKPLKAEGNAARPKRRKPDDQSDLAEIAKAIEDLPMPANQGIPRRPVADLVEAALAARQRPRLAPMFTMILSDKEKALKTRAIARRAEQVTFYSGLLADVGIDPEAAISAIGRAIDDRTLYSIDQILVHASRLMFAEVMAEIVELVSTIELAEEYELAVEAGQRKPDTGIKVRDLVEHHLSIMEVRKLRKM